MGHEDQKRTLKQLMVELAMYTAEHIDAALAQQRAQRAVDLAVSRREKAMDAFHKFVDGLIEEVKP